MPHRAPVSRTSGAVHSSLEPAVYVCSTSPFGAFRKSSAWPSLSQFTTVMPALPFTCDRPDAGLPPAKARSSSRDPLK
jgi:hypothetical protein